MTPVEIVDRAGESELREAVQQRAERKLPFHPGQRRAEAEVGAEPERDVVVRLPGDVETLPRIIV